MAPMASMKPYLDSAIASSQRVRQALYTLLLTALVFGAVTWNVRPDSWLAQDIDSLKHSITLQRQRIAHLKAQVALSTASIASTSSTSSTSATAPTAGSTPTGPDTAGPPPATDATANATDATANAADDADGSIDKADILEEIESLSSELLLLESLYRLAQGQYLDDMFFTFPALGLSFHANDLGLVGGSSLALLSILLCICQQKQLEVYDFCFTEASRNSDWDRHQCYQYLQLHQLLSAPPALDVATPSLLKTSVVFSKFIVFLPSLILGAVLASNLHSLPLVAGRPDVTLMIVSAAIALVLTTLALFRSLHLSFLFDILWFDTHKAITDAAAEPPGDVTGDAAEVIDAEDGS